MRSRSIHGLIPVGMVIAVLGATLGLFLVFPLLLTWSGERPFEWARLSDVGEAYSGVSPILSSFAFCGIALSLLLQWRLNRMTLLFSNRELHLELIKLALENRELLYVDGSVMADDPSAVRKVYANLLVGQWATSWDLGTLDPVNLRSAAARLFENELAREWWRAHGGSYATARGRRRFVAVIDGELRRAVAAGPGTAFEVRPTGSGRAAPAPPLSRRAWVAPAGLGVLSVVGVVAAVAVVSSQQRARQRGTSGAPRRRGGW